MDHKFNFTSLFMKIILFVLLLISAQIEVYAQQKQSKKSWGSRACLLKLLKLKN